MTLEAGAARDTVADVPVVLRIANASGQPLRLWVEPWGDHVDVDVGSAVKVLSNGIELTPLGVQLHETGLTLWWEWSCSGPEFVSEANAPLLDYRNLCA